MHFKFIQAETIHTTIYTTRPFKQDLDLSILFPSHLTLAASIQASPLSDFRRILVMLIPIYVFFFCLQTLYQCLAGPRRFLEETWATPSNTGGYIKAAWAKAFSLTWAACAFPTNDCVCLFCSFLSCLTSIA